MKDKNGIEIVEGKKLKDSEGVIYTVIRGDFKAGDYGEGPDLVADAGYVKSLLWPERAKEFEVIE